MGPNVSNYLYPLYKVKQKPLGSKVCTMQCCEMLSGSDPLYDLQIFISESLGAFHVFIDNSF